MSCHTRLHRLGDGLRRRHFWALYRFRRFVTAKTSRKWAKKVPAIWKMNSTRKIERESYAGCPKRTNYRKRNPQSCVRILPKWALAKDSDPTLRTPFFLIVCPFRASSIWLPFNFPRRNYFSYRWLFFGSFPASFGCHKTTKSAKRPEMPTSEPISQPM